jgi:hypothetical protein
MYPFQRVFSEVAVRVNAEDVTGIHREYPLATALPLLGPVPPAYRTRHPFQPFIQRRQMQQSVSFISNVK